MRAFHGFPCIPVIARVRRALIKGHDDVGADAALDVHRRLRAKQVLAAIDVAAERHALLGNLAAVRQAEHLITAAVRQNGAVPAHEFVQPAAGFEHIRARTQVQMVGIAQNDLRSDVLT